METNLAPILRKIEADTDKRISTRLGQHRGQFGTPVLNQILEEFDRELSDKARQLEEVEAFIEDLESALRGTTTRALNYLTEQFANRGLHDAAVLKNEQARWQSELTLSGDAIAAKASRVLFSRNDQPRVSGRPRAKPNFKPTTPATPKRPSDLSPKERENLRNSVLLAYYNFSGGDLLKFPSAPEVYDSLQPPVSEHEFHNALQYLSSVGLLKAQGVDWLYSITAAGINAAERLVNAAPIAASPLPQSTQVVNVYNSQIGALNLGSGTAAVHSAIKQKLNQVVGDGSSEFKAAIDTAAAKIREHPRISHERKLYTLQQLDAIADEALKEPPQRRKGVVGLLWNGVLSTLSFVADTTTVVKDIALPVLKFFGLPIP